MKVGRNDPCHCGSGKKYKKCHMREDQEAARQPMSASSAADLEGSVPLPAPVMNAEAGEASVPAEKIKGMEEAAAQLQASGDPAQMKKLQEQMQAIQNLMKLQSGQDNK